MNRIEILLQGEGFTEIEVIRLEAGMVVREVLHAAGACCKMPPADELRVFAEDEDEPLELDHPLPGHQPGKPLRLHVHRCHRVTVTVAFNGESETRPFGPARTIEAIRKWAALVAFKLAPTDAAEHVLQVAGTTNRPDPDTHVGALVSCPDCLIHFDLVPLKRVEGAW
jgi:hypothetical protein